MDPVEISTFQFDNWDIMPRHAVKVDEKATPKVNESLLLVKTRKRKGKLEEEYTSDAKRQRCCNRKSVSVQIGSAHV